MISHKISVDFSDPKKVLFAFVRLRSPIVGDSTFRCFSFRNSDEINCIEKPKSTWRDIKRKNPICFFTKPTITNGYIVFLSFRTAWIKKITIVFFSYPPNLTSSSTLLLVLTLPRTNTVFGGAFRWHACSGPRPVCEYYALSLLRARGKSDTWPRDGQESREIYFLGTTVHDSRRASNRVFDLITSTAGSALFSSISITPSVTKHVTWFFWWGRSKYNICHYLPIYIYIHYWSL